MKGATFLKVQMVDGYDIELYVYEPHTEIRTRGVIQLVHGSCEHVMRYEHFITDLVNQGYVVYANDLVDMEILFPVQMIMDILVKMTAGVRWLKI